MKNILDLCSRAERKKSIDSFRQERDQWLQSYDPEIAQRMSGRGRSALYLAHLNFPVFPLHGAGRGGCSCGTDCSSPGKHPRKAGGYRTATTNLDQVTQWWARYRWANIGCAPGAADLVVVDLDLDKRGCHDDWERLLAQHGGKLPTTVTTETGGGGVHLYFKNVFGKKLKSTAGKLGRGIDIRAEGGSVIMPSSRHASGRRYIWKPGRSPLEEDIAPLPEWLAEEIERPSAPLASQASGQLMGAGKIPVGQRNSSLFRRGCELVSKGLSAEELPEALAVINRTECEEALHDSELQSIAASVVNRMAGQTTGGHTRFTILDRRSLKERPEPEWLIEGVLLEKSFAMLVGPPYVGKTFVALDMAASLATGLDWLDYPIPAARPVLYITGEGQASFNKRVEAWEKDRGTELEHLSFLLNMPAFMQGSDVDQLIDAIRQVDVSPALIIIDTFARALSGGDENSGKDVGNFIRGCQQLEGAFGSAVLFLHHPGKSGDEYRGHSSLRAAVDTEIVAKPGSRGDFVLRCRKQKDAPEFADIAVELVPVGPSVVVRESLRRVPQFVSDDTGPSALLDVLQREFERLGRPVRHKEWLAGSRSPKSTFNRHVRSLLAAGGALKDGQGYTPAARATAA